MSKDLKKTLFSQTERWKKNSGRKKTGWNQQESYERYFF